MTFTRFGFHYGKTSPFRRFKEHHTEVNDMYWSYVPIAGYADHLARHAAPGTTPQLLFHATGPDVRRLAPTIAKWRSFAKRFDNWARLGALLSAVSYFEVYLRGVVELALRSDPLVRFGSSKVLDGVVWLKREIADNLESLIRPCVVGDWATRIRHYEKVFQTVPPVLTQSVGDLESIRILRNSVGHAFGRNLQSGIDPLASDGGAMEPLNEIRFKAWLGLLGNVAAAVDHHLGWTHVGEFEALWHYHRWRALPREEQEPRYEKSQAFARFMGRTISDNPPSRQFFQGLISYYEHL